jgi:hypothetical protein
MKIKDGYIKREVAGINMVVPVGEALVDFNGMITLNSSASFMWEQLQEEISEDELVKRVLEEYDIDEKTARADTEEFIEKLRQSNII